MHFFKFSLLGLSLLFVACSQIPFTEQHSFVVKKATDPATELGFKSDDLKTMVEKARELGGKASEFLATDLFIKANDASIRGELSNRKSDF